MTGALGGIALGHYLFTRHELQVRQLQYIREALLPVRAYANNMEKAARNLLIILVGVALGLPKATKKDVERSFKTIKTELMDKPWFPEIDDVKVETAFKSVSDMFAKSMLTFQLKSSTLKPSKTPIVASEEQLKQFVEHIGDEDITTLRGMLAPNEDARLVFDGLVEWLEAIRNLRREIMRVSTEG